MNKRRVGGRYEEKAAAFLEQQGLQILFRNFRCRQGEIDLIAYDRAERTVVFVEVKYRKTSYAGMPAEAVTRAKQKTICRVADYYRSCYVTEDALSFRFDVVAILGEELSWYRNAFPYQRYYR
ncbi:MAG: YraN family protein [Lachnospiraceae bacterium]|nr:YraN family protein [Lachnospiraceae bacterium]